MYYGWKIVGVTFVTHFISVGFIFYSYGVLFKALEADFGGSRLGVSLGITIMNIGTGIFAPFLGRALHHRSIRKIMCVGALFMGFGFYAASTIAALWQFYIVLAFLGLGAAMTGGLPGSTLVSNWFIRQRGFALGIATMGISLSGLIMAPLTTQLIAAMGWRKTFLVFGTLAMGIVMPLVWRYVINKPEDLGLRPDGDDAAKAMSPEDADEPMMPLAPGDQMTDHPGHLEWSSIGTLKERNFWVITVAIALNFFSMGAILTHMVPHVTDLGFSATKAAFVLSASAGSGVFGKLLFGWITDRIQTRLALWLAMAFQCVGVLCILNADTYPALLSSGAIFGFGMGGIVPLWGSLLGESFGRRAFGRVMGLMGPCMLPIQIIGVPYAGFIYDHYNTYNPAFKTFIGVYILAAAVLLALRQNTNSTPEPKPLQETH